MDYCMCFGYEVLSSMVCIIVIKLFVVMKILFCLNEIYFGELIFIFFFYFFLDCVRESRVFNIILNRNGLLFVIGVYMCGEFGNG